MRRYEKVTLTLGDLIVALTDEVVLITRDPARTNILVAYMLRDLLARYRVRLNNRVIPGHRSKNGLRLAK